MSKINPGPELPLFLAKYHYGDLIVNEGVLQFPLQKDLLVSHSGLPAEMQPFLDKQALPIGLVLNRVVELFSSYDDRVIPINIKKTGQLLGLSGLLSPSPFDLTQLNVSAGARTTFLLPNVSDATHHKKLITIYNAPPVINSVFDHWAVFKKLANYRFQHRYWSCELLFFSTSWVDKIKQADTVPWFLLKNYFYEQACAQNVGRFYLINNICLKNCLLKAMSRCQTSVSDYAFDTFQYLFLLQQGQVPGFQVSDGSEEYLPESTIQEAYVKDYKLKTYLPIIMCGAMWEGYNAEAPMYYSLNLPIVFSLAMSDMKNVRRTDLLQQLSRIIEDLNLATHCKYRYMHHQVDNLHGIEKAALVLQSDPRVIQLKSHYPGREISSSNAFVRGCIQLQKQL